MASQVNSIKHLEKRLTTILLKLFQNIPEGGTLLNSFYEAMITLILKPDTCHIERKLQANITDEHKKGPQALFTWFMFSTRIEIKLNGIWYIFTSLRSEERRVGKECRSRWSPYH